MDKQQFIEQYGKQRFEIIDQCDIFIKAHFGDVEAYALASDSMLIEGQPLEQIYQLLVKCEGLDGLQDSEASNSNVYAFPVKEKIAFAPQGKVVLACT